MLKISKIDLKLMFLKIRQNPWTGETGSQQLGWVPANSQILKLLYR